MLALVCIVLLHLPLRNSVVLLLLSLVVAIASVAAAATAMFTILYLLFGCFVFRRFKNLKL